MSNNKYKEMLITVITVTYNRAYVLPRALQSVNNQTYKNFEYIIIDDGSTDNTEKVVNEFIQNTDIIVKYYKTENQGVNAARAEGAKKAKTKFIVYIDSDDELIENAIETFYDIWYSFSEQEKEKYQLGIASLCQDASTNRILGGKFPKNINNKRKTVGLRYYSKDERHTMKNRKIFAEEFPFIISDEVKYIGEATRYPEIMEKYQFYMSNSITRRYFTDTTEDSFTRKKTLSRSSCRSGYISYLYRINNCYPSKVYPKELQLMNFYVYIKYGFNLGYSYGKILSDIKSTRNKVTCILMTPLGIVNYLLGKKAIKE